MVPAAIRLPYSFETVTIHNQGPEEDFGARLRRGDVGGAVECLYAAHALDVRRFVAHLDPPSRVEDLCQETWAAVVRALPAYRREATPRAWLFGIAKKKVLDARRRRRNADLLTTFDSREEFLSGMLPGRRSSSPSSKLVRHERAEALEKVLTTLKAEDRELLELRFICGLKPQDIVDVLGLESSPNAVSQRLLRLTRKVRVQLLRQVVFRPSHDPTSK